MDHSDTFDQVTGMEIAVIGLAGRFPGAQNLQEFWWNLQHGVESISFFSNDELAAAGVHHSVLNDPSYIKAFGVLDDIDLFDADFFGFTQKEAEILDPQQRIFLECAWNALEGAGYISDTYNNSISVYAGATMSSYFIDNLFQNPNVADTADAFSLAIGNDKDFLATRVSYKLNLRGTSITIQTACSTSLVAVHMACQSLLSGENDIALAGGVSICLPQKTGYWYQEGGIQSSDGHCRAFDVKADGTVGGNGVGIVVLKRLADAITDGDFIHAVIKGSAINNDGSLKVGYTAPSVSGQADVISEALAMAGVSSESITYVETHGTATPLGDPIEMAALNEAFHAATATTNHCAIGSVKTNVGHLDAAAGVTGLIKTILSLRHRKIPPSLHFEQPNPEIDFANSPFYVNTFLRNWQTGATQRRAGVSSFGIGGTNVHMILEEAPLREDKNPSRPYQLLVLSAKTSSALENITLDLLEHLKNHGELNLGDVAYTLQVGRRAFEHRRIVVCQDTDDAISVLKTLDSKRVFTSHLDSVTKPVVFMFPGQGTQYINMALELYHQEPVFRTQLDECLTLLSTNIGYELRSVLYPNQESVESAKQQLVQTNIVQPLLFAVEYALAKLLISWGIHPEAMIGHSIGEYVAACLAGIFTLEDALRLVTKRGELINQLPSGAMLALPLSEKEVKSLLNEKISLAAVNGAQSCVVSGLNGAIDKLEDHLTKQNIVSRRLNTSHAFHSEMMMPVAKLFQKEVEKVSLKPPQIPFVSNVTGDWIETAEATNPKYWVKHLHRTVRFADGLSTLLKGKNVILLEVGPGATLSTLAKRHPNKQEAQSILCSLPQPYHNHPDTMILLNTLGQLWLEGIDVYWSKLYVNERRQRLPLPTYPFERMRYWIERPLNIPNFPTNSDATIESNETRYIASSLSTTQNTSKRSSNSTLHDKTESSELEVDQLLLQQLNIMSQQLEVLHATNGIAS